MKVLVVGATGLTGGHAVRLLLARGDEVTAFVRDPASWRESHEHLRVAKGEARDADSLVAAVKGQDAVLSAFGPRSLKKDDLQEVYMRNLLAAMTANGPNLARP
ncbi:MAG: NAD(P)H-binding protein [Myxococcota bacterium]